TSMFDSRLNIGNGTFSWQYDVLNQMTGEKSMAGLTRLYEYQYAFDAAGNRTQMSYYNGSTTVNTSYSHNDGNQLTIRSNGPQWGYTYDANGNMTIEDLEGTPQRTFSWNRDDRLTQVVKSGQTVQYTYDAMGRRLMKHVPVTNTSTLYFYEGLTVIAEKEKVGSGSWTWKRVFTIAPGVIGQILRVSENTGSVWADTYYHYDAIGNVALQTASDGSPVQPFDQDAYGNIRLGTQEGYHLTTKEFDSSANLYYFWQRWYDPGIGRFLSKAPYPSHIEHQFGYCENNTINQTDQAGMIPEPLLPGDVPRYPPGHERPGDGDIPIGGIGGHIGIHNPHPPYRPIRSPNAPSFRECFCACMAAGSHWSGGAVPFLGRGIGVLHLPAYPTLRTGSDAGVMAYFALLTTHCTIACSGPEPLYGEWGGR
ncbi:MAG TPA: RHS repeat-associated core domain-containing protein, partial [Candidatus Sumerlaeota bacterium]|nr:RHS repeat-associated core domain-containing protein [Candidatus Sumerlaeota bacterium]